MDILRKNSKVTRKAVGDMIRRCRLCMNREGGHVESFDALRLLNNFSRFFIMFFNLVGEMCDIGIFTVEANQQRL